MKKLVPFLLVIWLLIGMGSFFVWWKVTRNLTAVDVTNHANKIAKELEIPWAFRFKRIRPSYGADFKVAIEGIDAVSGDGVRVLHAKTAEVRLPWSIFFSRNPIRINIAIDEINVTSWSKVLSEIELFLDKRKSDRTQQMSLPQQVVDSTFNFRMTNLTGPWNDKVLNFKKLYLLNVDPNSPTAFEVVYPWEFEVNGAKLIGETKALGEYRVSLQKADLHYYLKTKIQTQREARSRSAEFSVEGKGFYHPRMGLFSTLSAKDEWVAFVGDLEWTPNNLKLNFPKFAVSHDLVLELMPFSGLHGGTSPYQSSAITGDLMLFKSPDARQLKLNVRTKSNAKVTLSGGKEVPFSFQLTNKNEDYLVGGINLGGTNYFEIKKTKKNSFLKWVADLFMANKNSDSWLSPHDSVWNLVKYLPWDRLNVSVGDSVPYVIQKIDDNLKISQFSPSPEFPLLSIIYALPSRQIHEWSAEFQGRPLDEMFKRLGIDFPFIPGHAYTGAILQNAERTLRAKLTWQGGVLPLLSKSSCKALLQDKAELQALMGGSFVNQAELDFTESSFKLKRWSLRDQSSSWDISGEWDNAPIRCDLKLVQKQKSKKPITHNITLN